jgi:hypothetical protein
MRKFGERVVYVSMRGVHESGGESVAPYLFDDWMHISLHDDPLTR